MRSGRRCQRPVTTLNFLFCHEDLDAAARVGGAWSARSARQRHLFWTREAYPTCAYHASATSPRRRSRETGAPGDRAALPEGIGVGDPDIIAAIERWESVGVDGINFC